MRTGKTGNTEQKTEESSDNIMSEQPCENKGTGCERRLTFHVRSKCGVGRLFGKHRLIRVVKDGYDDVEEDRLAYDEPGEQVAARSQTNNGQTISTETGHLYIDKPIVHRPHTQTRHQ